MKAVRLPMYESAGAEFDITRVYRYSLHRMWGGGSLTDWTTMLWIMLNPSTADERVLDPTLRRCQGYSTSFGHDGFEVANLFAFRATDQRKLRHVADPVGPENDTFIVQAVERADVIVCGWGLEKDTLVRRRAAAVMALLAGRELFCLGRNIDGSPVHPLYRPKSAPLQPYSR